MSDEKQKAVGLKRTPPPARKGRIPWGLLIGIIALLGLAALVLWLFWPSIRSSFEAAPTLPPAAESVAPGGLLYQTSFEAESDFAQWRLFDTGAEAAVAEQGRLLLRIDSPEDSAAWSSLELTFTDFNLIVSSLKIDGADDNGISVIFRETDPANFNRFDISSDGYYALSMVRDGVQYLVSDWRFTESINRGQSPNQVRVIATGAEFRFEVNGQALPLCLSSDPAVGALWDPFAEAPTCLGGVVQEHWLNADLPAGRIGLGAQGFVGFDGENTTPAFTVIAFDELLITAP